MRGENTLEYLHKYKCSIWDKDAIRYFKSKGFSDDKIATEGHKMSLGPIYGVQWREYSRLVDDSWDVYLDGVDQIKSLINQLKKNPLSSGMVVSAWNPGELSAMCLPPCHWSFQITCEPKKDSNDIYLDLTFNLRSSDVLLGLPFNIASYALLAEILAAECGMIARYVRYSGTNVHLYDNQMDAAAEQLSKDPEKFDLPVLKLPMWEDFYTGLLETDPKEFRLERYLHYNLETKVKMLTYNK